MEHRLGADVDPSRRAVSSSSARDLRPPGVRPRLELLAQPRRPRRSWRTPTRRTRAHRGPVVPQRRQARCAVVVLANGGRAALAARHVARRHARSRARPVSVEHADDSPVTQLADDGGATSEGFHGSSRCGRPPRAAATRPARRRPPARLTQAAGPAAPRAMGTAKPARTGPPPAARSTATSRACHVGARSSCSASSCSSSTTTAPRPGHGAHAAARAPTTTSTPRRGLRPLARHRPPPSARPGAAERPSTARRRRRDGCDDECRARRATAASTTATGRCRAHAARRHRSRAARRTGRAPAAVHGAHRRRGGQAATMAAGALARTVAAAGPAPAAQRASSTTSAGGPRPEPWRSAAAVTARLSAGPTGSRQPIRRRAPPVQVARARRADARTSAERAGDEVVELLVEAGDVGQRPRATQRGPPRRVTPGRRRP